MEFRFFAWTGKTADSEKLAVSLLESRGSKFEKLAISLLEKEQISQLEKGECAFTFEEKR